MGTVSVNFWQLKVFCTVARVKSLSGAARILYVTQPAVSAQISTLERRFGTRLLRRHRYGVSLTPSGQIVFEFASRILALMDDMEAAVTAAEKSIG